MIILRAEKEFRAVKLSIDKENVKIAGKDGELLISLPEIRRVGVEKRFNKVLASLVVVMAIISLATSNALYLLLTFIMLAVTGMTREEILIIEYGNNLVKVRGLQKAELNKALNFFKEYFTHL